MKIKQFILALAFIVLPLVLLAQGPGRGAGMQAQGRLYNPSTETTLKGTVDEVQQMTGRRPGMTGTEVMLKTGTGTIPVLLGPSAFLASQQLTLAKGDQLEVTGSRTKLGGQDVVIAREVKKDEKKVTLRDAQGFPVWSRGGRRPQ